MSSAVPEGWGEKQLSQICNIVGGGTPERANSEYWDGEIPWVSPTEITSLTSRYISITKEAITELGLKKSSAKLHPAGTLLMTSRASIGYVAINTVPMTTNQGFQSLQCGVDAYNEFMYQYITWSRPELKRISAGSTFAEISSSNVKKIKVTLPPLPEQLKIATILSSVDDVITKTTAQIDKLKDLKTGMMQELLTKGIGHTEFKDSPVGRIPVGWECELLDKVAKRGSGHTPDKTKPEYWNEGVKWVSLSDSSRLDQLYISDTVKNISQLGIENSSAVLHPEGTVVLSRDAGIGKSAITTQSMAVSQHFMAWVCSDRLDNHFLYHLLQHWKPKFEAIAMGSTIKTIGLPYFKKMMIPVPPISEQLQIAESITSVDQHVFSLQRKNWANMDAKKALMQDLLTGNVRVAVDS